MGAAASRNGAEPPLTTSLPPSLWCSASRPPLQAAPIGCSAYSAATPCGASSSADTARTPCALVLPGRGGLPREAWLRAGLGIPSVADSRPADVWEGQPSLSEAAALDALALSAATRVSTANVGSRLGTALGWLARFRAAFPHRVFLRARGEADDMSAAAYNAQSFALLAEFIRAHGSVRVGARGACVGADAVDGYVSSLRAHLSVIANHRLVSRDVDTRRPLQFKQMRREDPVRGSRRRRTGVRARHFREAAPRFERSSRRGGLRWTAALAAHSLLLRGAEVGHGDSGDFDPLTGLTWSEHSQVNRTGTFEWLSPTDTHSAFHAVVVWVVPVKGGVRAARHPILVRARQPGEPAEGPPADPLCLYSHLRWRWLSERRLHQASDPFFAFPDDGSGRGEQVLRTRDMHTIAVEIVTLAGEDASDTSAHGPRIGAATDIRDILGVEAGRAVITDRGRWADLDLNFIYQRVTVREQLHISAEMLQADSLDLEFLFRGWAQPARRGRRG